MLQFLKSETAGTLVAPGAAQPKRYAAIKKFYTNMQFVIIAYDGKDADAYERRMATRPAHVELGNKLRDAGRHLYGVAILDESKKIIGSILVVDFATRADLDEWLKIEPYIVKGVWEKFEIQPCEVGPSFKNLITAA